MLQKILLQCRLVQFRRAVGYSPLLAAWQEFFREFELDEVEVTYYSINRKRRIYIRLGAWDKASHPSRTPAEIWSAAVAGKVSTENMKSTVNESVNVFLNFHCCTLFSHRIHRVMFLINY